MKKCFVVSILFVFMGLVLLGSCSQEDNPVLSSSETSASTTYVDNMASDEFTELGKIPKEYLESMDNVEKEAWLKLSTKYLIKKNTFCSEFYKKHKADIIERITFLYDIAVKKNVKPTYLSFIWADRETEKKNLRLINEVDTADTVDPPLDIDSGYVDYKKKEWYSTTSCEVYSNVMMGITMTIRLDFKVIEYGNTIEMESLGSCYYSLYPFDATYQGLYDLYIDEDYLAHCNANGKIYVKSQYFRVNHYSTCDLLEHYKNTKPQY